jgi:hypothetical protein
MDTKIVKHSPGDRVEFAGCAEFKLCEWPKGEHWLWTSNLSYDCFSVVIITAKVGLLMHLASKPPEGYAVEASVANPYRAYFEKLLGPFKENWRLTQKYWYDARLFVVTPTHASSSKQEDALEWFITSVEQETQLRARKVKYMPRINDKSIF